jgi:two-component system chemotaxis sensor kinase CheA
MEEYASVCDKIYSCEPYNLDDLRQNVLRVKPSEAITSVEIDGSIRIKVKQIDEIVRQVNMLLIKQLHLRKSFEVLNSIEERYHDDTDDRRQGERNKALEILNDIKKLKSDFGEYSSDLENSTYELQERIVNLRMLPLELILDTFPRMVEEISETLSKEINLDITGANVKLDKFLLEKIKDPLLHIIRNAIDHGIESKEDRLRKNKPIAGNISIQCKSDGGHIIIRIQDDGKGLDYEKIKRRAVELNMVTEEEIENTPSSQLNHYLFVSGFSTKERTTELSGRGLGMDIVKTNVEEIKGKISIESEKDKGTTFIISLPSSLSTVDGFFVITGNKKFLIPSHFVKETLLIYDIEKIKIMNKVLYKYRKQIIPIYELSSVIDIQMEEEKESQYLIILENVGEIVGMCVDSMISYNTLVSKPLPRHLQKLISVQGVVFDEHYNLIPILYIPVIIDKFKKLRSIDTKKRFIQRKKIEKTILVVDDSLNTREIEKSMLESSGYSVITASDGIDGLQKLKEKKIDLLITDINMPRMDGFTLVENMKKEEQYKNTPVIMISSMQDDESMKRAISIGVNDFIIKSKFDQNNLINKVQSLIGKVK